MNTKNGFSFLQTQGLNKNYEVIELETNGQTEIYMFLKVIMYVCNIIGHFSTQHGNSQNWGSNVIYAINGIFFAQSYDLSFKNF